MRVIDVYDGNDIQDFGALKGQIDGLVTKVLQGVTGVQKNFRYRYTKCKELGIPIGFYHWLSSYSEPEEQAEKFWSLISGYNFDIVPMLDIETGEGKYKEQWNVVSVEDYAKRFLTKFKEISGLNMIIYSGEYFIIENFSVEFCNNNYWWIAKYYYDRSCNHDIVKIDKCGGTTAWQYSDRGHIDGISGYVDLDIICEPEHFFLNGYSRNVESVQDIQQVSVNSEIARLQSILNKQGFRDSSGNELVCDGIPGKKTLSACPEVRKGAKGEITGWIQLRVGLKGDHVDNDFGEETEKYVKHYQKSKGITKDGIVFKETWNEFFKEMMGW